MTSGIQDGNELYRLVALSEIDLKWSKQVNGSHDGSMKVLGEQVDLAKIHGFF